MDEAVRSHLVCEEAEMQQVQFLVLHQFRIRLHVVAPQCRSKELLRLRCVDEQAAR